MMALRSVINSRLPIVIILGATGTGKTKLGVELAQRYNTEIISADSMQIYKGLDIVTAKASTEEQALARHHLLDILEPHQVFTVVDFRNRAMRIIDDLMERKKMPIIVGGTNYYVESIVYNILVEDTDDSEELLCDKGRKRVKAETNADDKNKRASSSIEDNGEVSNKEEKVVTDLTKANVEEFVENESRYTNDEVLDKLKSIDPEMASRYHPNNRRKILRSIEVWLKTGRRHSEVLAEQRHSEGRMRWPGQTVILWLKCQQDALDERLNTRVDAMLQAGLIQELLDFHHRHNEQRIKDGRPADFTKGIFQTLGLKEFHEYLILNEQQRQSEEGKKLLQESIENMKMATRRYARRQNKMTKSRFLEHPRREVPPVYELDVTDLSKWDEQVNNKAIHIIESYLNETPCDYVPTESNMLDCKKELNSHSSNYCEICERLIIGDKEYAIHIKSQKHLRVIKSKKRKELKNKKQDESESV